MATPIVSDRTFLIDQLTRNINNDPELNIYVSSYELILCSFFPDLSEAVCCVRDVVTSVVRQTLASNLLAFSYGKDAYLLELTSAVGGQK
jgi:hypothetical protein